MGALLHDVGKGYPGDHTEVGMELIPAIAGRMGFAPEDVSVLVDLEGSRVLEVAQGRTQEAADDLWNTLCEEQKNEVQAVAIISTYLPLLR